MNILRPSLPEKATAGAGVMGNGQFDSFGSNSICILHSAQRRRGGVQPPSELQLIACYTDQGRCQRYFAVICTMVFKYDPSTTNRDTSTGGFKDLCC